MTAREYLLAIPSCIFVNTLGAGLPVVVLMHVLFLPSVCLLCPVHTRSITNKLTSIGLAGLFHAVFSLFDQGCEYNGVGKSVMTVTYILMTQTLVGMGKVAFTVVTGNPLIHFATLHVLSARVPYDTKMYAEIFGIVA